MPKMAADGVVDLGRWPVSPEFVSEYLAVLGDDSPAYANDNFDNRVPPMALAARALALLIERLDLPPGTVHTSQEVTAKAPVAVGDELSLAARPSRPFRRGGWEFLSVEFSARRGADEVLAGKTTVMTPVSE